MYTVSKGPSKIVAKTRRGISQNLERLENLRDSSRRPAEPEDGEIVSVPKPVFHPINGQKKSSSLRAQQEVISPQHEEIIKFIYESWTSVCKECEEESQSENQKNGGGSRTNFKPFDLESWWGKRLFNTITKSIP
ncbi:MAPK regulated corepressor interacting protein 2 isoform X2 [Lycorma delicatula]|uniref:MAPK regulated corepressor interacting protein 2 isoform X2 n=1 Tax=Lycorma delicatula TaxID=130591 RepID=UPI003F511907